jgi:hypothetical protein
LKHSDFGLLLFVAYVSAVVVHGVLVHVLEHQVPNLPRIRMMGATPFPETDITSSVLQQIRNPDQNH